MKIEVQPGYHVDTRLRKEPFYPGEQFNLDDEKEARRLIDLGVVKEVTDESKGGSKTGTLAVNVTKAGELIAAVSTIEELEELTIGDERKGVQDAKAKRLTELQKSAE